MRALIICFVLVTIVALTNTSDAAKTQIYTTATVRSFGTYSYSGDILCEVTSAGDRVIGTVTVNGMFNGDYPWVMRIYTDNTNFVGAAANFGISRGGLISEDGRYVIPLHANCANFGDEWRYIPDINDVDSKPYSAPSYIGVIEYNDCVVMGIDPRNAVWVAGPDGVLFTADDNALGDTTLVTPFDISIKANFDETAVRGNYSANLYIELVQSP